LKGRESFLGDCNIAFSKYFDIFMVNVLSVPVKRKSHTAVGALGE